MTFQGGWIELKRPPHFARVVSPAASLHASTSKRVRYLEFQPASTTRPTRK